MRVKHYVKMFQNYDGLSLSIKVLELNSHSGYERYDMSNYQDYLQFKNRKVLHWHINSVPQYVKLYLEKVEDE